MPATLLDTFQRLLRSPAFKFFLIGFLGLLLGIPLLFVMELTAQRDAQSRGVASEIALHWGQQQHLAGPFLVVPYTVKIYTLTGDKRVEEVVTRRAIFLPEKLDIEGRAGTQVLSRSIYDVTVYTSDLTLQGRFERPDMREVASEIVTVRWDEASFALGIADVAGIKEAGVLRLSSGDEVALEPSIGADALAMSGVHASLRASKVLTPAAAVVSGSPATGIEPFDFEISLKLSGSSGLQFAPAARTTTVKLASDWPHPSFYGSFLPVDRKVDAAGFTASWTVPHLARSVPQSMSVGAGESGPNVLFSYLFGVSFQTPVDFYSLVVRALKYGMMFIAVAFMTVFLMELLAGKRVHPVQYLFTGVALIFFFVLLLSFAEHIGFAPAYALASLVTAGQLGLYVGSVLESKRRGLWMCGLLLFIFGLLYLILQLEDYALLAGAVAGFLMLSAVMFLTLRVDWSGGGLKQDAGTGAATTG